MHRNLTRWPAASRIQRLDDESGTWGLTTAARISESAAARQRQPYPRAASCTRKALIVELVVAVVVVKPVVVVKHGIDRRDDVASSESVASRLTCPSAWPSPARTPLGVISPALDSWLVHSQRPVARAPMSTFQVPCPSQMTGSESICHWHSTPRGSMRRWDPCEPSSPRSPRPPPLSSARSVIDEAVIFRLCAAPGCTAPNGKARGSVLPSHARSGLRLQVMPRFDGCSCSTSRPALPS